MFAAGDSDTDIEFLRDATYKLVLNRNKKELMCHAYYNEGEQLAREPDVHRAESPAGRAVPCSTTACKRADGTSAPCLDENGAVIPDQADTVY